MADEEKRPEGEKKEEILVWEDKEGRYKLGYSQFLETQRLRYNKLIFVALCVLIVLIVAGGIYAWELVQRIDAMNALSKIGGAAVSFLLL
jgi:hypothetical protein